MHPTARLLAPCVPLARTRPAAACQVEQGTSYFFKVQVAEAEFIQLRVFLSMFGDAPQLVALRKGVDAAGRVSRARIWLCACTLLGWSTVQTRSLHMYRICNKYSLQIHYSGAS